MNLKRIAVLISKEFRYGSKNMIFFFAIIVPVVISLLISLMVGSLFAGRPRLGVADSGESHLVENLAELDFLRLRVYQNAETLHENVSIGALDMGLVLPPDFDQHLLQGAPVSLTLYTWGESLLKHRTTLGATLVNQVIHLSGVEIPVSINTVLLGDAPSISWDVRLFPMVMIMTVILGGTMLPATFIVQEKQNRTLTAVLVTPVTPGEALAAKGITGVMISFVMGVIILTLNTAWGGRPLLHLTLLALSAIMAAIGGVILGILVKDINTLFTAMKSVGILLYAPAILYIFPEVPGWIKQVFPTYYMIGPIVEVSLNNAGWNDIFIDVIILCLIIGLMVAVTNLIVKRHALFNG